MLGSPGVMESQCTSDAVAWDKVELEVSTGARSNRGGMLVAVAGAERLQTSMGLDENIMWAVVDSEFDESVSVADSEQSVSVADSEQSVSVADSEFDKSVLVLESDESVSVLFGEDSPSAGGGFADKRVVVLFCLGAASRSEANWPEAGAF